MSLFSDQTHQQVNNEEKAEEDELFRTTSRRKLQIWKVNAQKGMDKRSTQR